MADSFQTAQRRGTGVPMSAKAALLTPLLFTATPGWAQEPPSLDIPPTIRVIDDMNVDRAGGDFVAPALSISVGSEGNGLSRTLTNSSVKYWGNFQEDHDGRITTFWEYPGGGDGDAAPAPTITTISYEGHTEIFDVAISEYINSYGGCANGCNFVVGSRGSSLTCWPTNCTLTEKNGTLVEFVIPHAGSWDPGVPWPDFGRITKITKPDGEIVDFTYYIFPIDSQRDNRFLKAVSSSLGWMIKYEGNSNQYANHIAYKAWAFNRSIDYCDINADSCSFSKSWPEAEIGGIGSIPPLLTLKKNGVTKVVYSRNPNSPTYGFNSAAGERLSRITSPSGVVTDLTFWDQSAAKNCVYHPTPGVIVNCGPWYKDGRIATVKLGNSTWSYDYNDPGVPGWGGIPDRVNRVDPVGGTTKVRIYAGGGGAGPSIDWSDDELGRRTSFIPDNWGYPTRITYPEGNYIAITYDARHNVTERRMVAAPGTGLADLVETAYFDTSCGNLKACGKVLWTRSAEANTPAKVGNPNLRTDYVYDPVHGGVVSITAPPDANGARPQIRFYPKIRDAGGNLVNSTPVWRLTRKEACASSTNSCSGTAGEQVQLFEYNQNNLLLTASTTRDGAGSIQSRIEYGYDDVGNLVSTDGPRQDTDDKSYTVWDVERRPVYEIGVDPDGSGPLPRLILKHSYDADGREVLIQKGTGTGIAFSGGIPVGVNDFVATTSKQNIYDSVTGRKIREVTAAP
jgi:hypothetical protein